MDRFSCYNYTDLQFTLFIAGNAPPAIYEDRSILNRILNRIQVIPFNSYYETLEDTQ